MRAMQTLKKLPHTAPNTAATAVIIGEDSKAAISLHEHAWMLSVAPRALMRRRNASYGSAGAVAAV